MQPAIFFLFEGRSHIFLQVAIGALLAALAALLVFLWRLLRRIARITCVLRSMSEGNFSKGKEVEESAKLDPEFAASVEKIRCHAIELLESNRSLMDERNRSAAIMRSMAEGIAAVDAADRISFCNEAFAAIWNVPRSSIEGKSILEAIRLPEIVELIRRVLRGEEGIHTEISTGGPVRPQTFFVTVAPVLAFGSEAAKKEVSRGAVLVMHEMTELRRLEQMRKDFVANVSHELRTPLTAIQGFAETLLGGALEDRDNSRRFVEIIRDHSARLSQIIDGLLKLSRIEAGNWQTDVQSIELGKILSLEEEAARTAAAKKGILLNAAPFATKLRVRGNGSLLREVIRNLLDNAIQYTDRGGQITVSVGSAANFAVITVADTGIGIPQTEQSRIFERFYRVDDARSRDGGGTGLGLAIAKHIVESHGGKIWVESSVGEGSKFHFSIPLDIKA